MEKDVPGQQFIIPGIALLILLRIVYLRRHSLHKDIRDAFIPASKHLRPADFFRRPRSEDVRFAFWIMPYGILWYAINLPLMRLANYNGKGWVYLITIVDSIFLYTSFQLGLTGALLYVAISTIQALKAPWNVSILWLTLLGIYSWIFLILAPLAKLPFGVPTKTWGHARISLFHQHNYYYYGLLAIFWIFIFWRTILPWLFAGTWLGQIVSLNL